MERTAGLMKPRYLIPIIYLALMALVLALPWLEGGSTPQPWLWLLSAVVFLAMAVGWCALGDRIGFPDIHTVFRRKYRRYREDFKVRYRAAGGCSEDQAIDLSLDARLQEAVLDDVPLAKFVQVCASLCKFAHRTPPKAVMCSRCERPKSIQAR